MFKNFLNSQHQNWVKWILSFCSFYFFRCLLLLNFFCSRRLHFYFSISLIFQLQNNCFIALHLCVRNVYVWIVCTRDLNHNFHNLIFFFAAEKLFSHCQFTSWHCFLQCFFFLEFSLQLLYTHLIRFFLSFVVCVCVERWFEHSVCWFECPSQLWRKSSVSILISRCAFLTFLCTYCAFYSSFYSVLVFLHFVLSFNFIMIVCFDYTYFLSSLLLLYYSLNAVSIFALRVLSFGFKRN